MKKIKFLLALISLPAFFSCQNDDLLEKENIPSITENSFLALNGKIVKKVIHNDTLSLFEIADDSELAGNYLLGDDMLFDKEQLDDYIAQSKKQFRTNGVGTPSLIKRWPNNTIHYSIDSYLSSKVKHNIKMAIGRMQGGTNLKFKPYNPYESTDYILFQFISGDASFSPVGRIGGRQVINLSSNATQGVIIHEICHSLGLFHEHQRSDRDYYIKIHTANIDYNHPKANVAAAFKKLSFPEVPRAYIYSDGGLDFNSIMMYAPTAFSKNGKPTITKLDGSLYQLRPNGLSAKDKECLNRMYPNLSIDVLKAPAHPFYQGQWQVVYKKRNGYSYTTTWYSYTCPKNIWDPYEPEVVYWKWESNSETMSMQIFNQSYMETWLKVVLTRNDGVTETKTFKVGPGLSGATPPA
ncbi:hypothetical protein FUAX_34130 [Fulvitalea axinellae]|uniref:Peptidase M12A domain-containing protein n=1 Tax=Fulvitalea axinellae TaxID=1182444 RepID=A0AAU9CPB0_9BACT|nr:hypothetical protein FUAX_34130 [Fulvitalea axinellae]